MKINLTPRSQVLDPDLQRTLREHARQLNDLSEGRIQAKYAALTSVPAAGTYARGDEVYNSAPLELGTSPNKYVIHGWKCVLGGTPGTFVEMRYLTGN